jgi:hypothetical protein
VLTICVGSMGGCESQQSWQSAAAPASPGAVEHIAVEPPLLEPLLVLLPLLEVLPLLLVLPLLEVLPLLLVLPLFDELLPLLLPEPPLLLFPPPPSPAKPGVAVLEQPLV